MGNGVAGLIIEGRRTDGTIGNLLDVYHNSGSVADAVNYNGKISSDFNIVNKKYVDDALGTGTSGSTDWADPDRWNVQSPPGRPFNMYNGTNPQANGTFSYYESSGQLYLALNRKDANGCRWMDMVWDQELNSSILFRVTEFTSNNEHKTIRFGELLESIVKMVVPSNAM